MVKGASQQFNPTIHDGVVAQAVEADPAAARAEWLGEFRSDLEAFVTREAAARVAVPGRIELPRMSGVAYRAFLDFAGGSLGGDSATLAIAHDERWEDRSVIVLDLVREVRPPFSPEQVCQEFAGTLRAYGLTTATSDKWGGMFPIEQMSKLGIRVVPSAKAKSDIYKGLLPLINSAGIELLAQPRLLAQLVGLEWRTGSGGRDSIDHSPGAHDDVINAAAGALTLGAFMAHPGSVAVIDCFSGRIITGFDADGDEWKDGRLVIPPFTGPTPWYPARPGRPVPTVRIAHPGFSQGVVINQADFDAKIHALWHEPEPQPAAPTAPLGRRRT